jgi:6-phosphofructokinase 1
MGRKIGFIPASARLADPERKMPLLMILPEALSESESEKNLSYIAEKVNEKLSDFGRCIVVIGEGVNLGSPGVLRDSFGHAQFSSSATSTEQILTNYLNGIDRKDGKTRLIVRGNARCEKPGTRQRREAAYVSEVDLSEAYNVGRYAANIALSGESGYMATIVRIPGISYKVRYEKVLLKEVANSEREFPREWITKDRMDVTEDFIKWAIPLIGGKLHQFSTFSDIFAEKKCSAYIPVAFRDK